MDISRLSDALRGLRDGVFRAKGFFAGNSSPEYVDWSHTGTTRYELPNYSGEFGLVLIGARAQEHAIRSLAASIESGLFDQAAR